MSELLDEIEQFDVATNALILSMERRIAGLQRAYESEKAIVSKIWELLGNPTYSELNGRSIYDLIAEKDRRIKELEAHVSSLQEDLLHEQMAHSQFGMGA